VKGSLNFTNAVQTFTPTWLQGFGSAPSGDFSYIDFGAFVILWNDADLLGSNNDAAIVFDNMPVAIRPSANRVCVASSFSNSVEVPTRYLVATNGSVVMQPFVNDSGTRITYGLYPGTGTAGLPAGQVLIYVK
jgi:hypothetical protein